MGGTLSLLLCNNIVKVNKSTLGHFEDFGKRYTEATNFLINQAALLMSLDPVSLYI